MIVLAFDGFEVQSYGISVNDARGEVNLALVFTWYPLNTRNIFGAVRCGCQIERAWDRIRFFSFRVICQPHDTPDRHLRVRTPQTSPVLSGDDGESE